MKIYFSKWIFIDESRVPFDGPDVWAKGWIFTNSDVPVTKRRQQGGESVMIWAGIVDQTIIASFKVEGVKRNVANDFMDKIFFPCFKFQSRCFEVKCVSMHDNAPSHVSKLTSEFFLGLKIYR